MASSFAEKFTAVNHYEYLRCYEMERGRKYPIIKIESTPTKYGDTLLATIQDPNDAEKEYRVFLPKRYSNVFTDDELKAITPKALNLIYRGKREQMTLLDIVHSKYN